MARPSRILITGARAPVALHLVRLLAGDGTAVFLADSYDYPLGKASSRHSGYIKLPMPRYDLDGYGRAVSQAVVDHDIDLIIPTCEEVFFLAMLVDQGLLAAPLLAPDLAMLTTVHDKYAFIELANGYGLAVPNTRLVTSSAGLHDTDPRKTVYKPVWSRFASDVLIKPTAAQLGKIAPTADTPWVAQDLVDGEEISVYAMARAGRPVAFAAYRSVFKAGKGAGVCFEPVLDNAVRDWVFSFIKASAWHGQVSFDFIRAADGTVLPLECNPRATSGLHFFSHPPVFSEVMWNGGTVAPDIHGQLSSRLALWIYGLPQAIKTARVGAFWHSLRNAGEILDWPDDHAPVKAQFRALQEIAGIAIRQRISLQQASTRDIEWNGPNSD
jgi:hypothetical protein